MTWLPGDRELSIDNLLVAAYGCQERELFIDMAARREGVVH